MTTRIHPAEKRAAAVADYRDSGDTIAAVAARHGIARATLGNWAIGVRSSDDIALTGGRWVIDLRRRVQVWEAS